MNIRGVCDSIGWVWSIFLKGSFPPRESPSPEPQHSGCGTHSITPQHGELPVGTSCTHLGQPAPWGWGCGQAVPHLWLGPCFHNKPVNCSLSSVIDQAKLLMFA